LPVELDVVPTQRDADGLALSSRNVMLTPLERSAAPGLYAALRAMTNAVANGEVDRNRIVAAGRAHVRMPLREAYLDVVDAQTFVPVDAIDADRPLLAIGSVWLGSTRLIDNVPLSAASRTSSSTPVGATR
jgi:pantoate--beta-alanine ligase